MTRREGTALETVDMNLGTLSDPLFEHALSRPDVPALVQRETRLTYSGLAGLVGRSSVHLHALGVRPGEVVAVGLGFGIDAVVLTLALLRLGAIPVDVAGIRPAGLALPIARFQVRRVLAPAVIEVPEGVVCHAVDAPFHTLIAGLGGDRRNARDPAAVHLLHLAPDRRGGPKAITVTQHQMQARMRTARLLFPAVFAPGPSPMMLLSGGMGFAVMTLMAVQFALGGPVGLLPPDPDAGRTARLIAGAGDAVALVPEAVCRKFLEIAPAEGLLFPKLRGLIRATSLLSPAEGEALARRVAAKVWPMHGSAATGLVAGSLPGPCGAGVWAEAADGAGQVVPPGTVGHLRYRGPGVSFGLYRAPAEEQGAEGFRGGWYVGGEVGMVAIDGTITVTGQAGDLLRRRGLDMFLPQIEDAIREYSGTEDAAVVAIIPPGEKEPLLIGIVVPKGAPDLAGLARHCAAALPVERRPDRLAFVKELPRLADGKIDRRKLAGMAVRGEAAKQGHA